MSATVGSEAARPPGSIRSRALRGTLVSLLGQGGAQGLRLVSNLLLSRLLFPEAFGLMAIVRMLQNGLTMVSDIGIGASVIRHERGDERAFLDTAWTIQTLRGAALWALGAALAFPLARFYGQPELAWMIVAATAGAFVAGFNSTKLITLNRRLDLERVVAIELGGQALALVAMVTFAWYRPSVWALVTGGLVAAAFRLTASHLVIPGPTNRLRWEPVAAREIISFGKWILVSTFITFIAMRFDVVMLAKLIPMDELGIYSIGMLIAGVPRVVLDKINQTILLPAFSAARLEGPERLAIHFDRARRIALPACGLALLAAAAAAPAFFLLLYDARYHDAGWVAQLALLGLWFTFLDNASGRALAALGDSRALAMSNAVRLATTVLGCMGGWAVAGLPGVLLGLAFGGFCGQVCIGLRLRRHGLHCLGQDLAYTAVGLLLGAAICGVPYLAAGATGVSEPLLTAALGAIVLGPLSVGVGRSVWRELRSPSRAR